MENNREDEAISQAEFKKIENNKNICSYNILATETMTSLDNIEEIFKKYDSIIIKCFFDRNAWSKAVLYNQKAIM